MNVQSITEPLEESNVVIPGDYAIVVATSQHTFAGDILWTNGNDVMLKDARLLYWWMSHLILTDLAQHGFDTRAFYSLPRPVKQMMVAGAVAILKGSEMCRESLTNAPVTPYERSPIIARFSAAVESDVNPYQDTFGT